MDIPFIEADINKLQSICNWKATISIEKTIEDTLSEWRKVINNRV